MSVKTIKKATVKKKGVSAPKPLKKASSRMSKIDEAILVMTDRMARAREETREEIKEMARVHRETDRAIKESLKKLHDNIWDGVGGLRNSICHIVEMVLLPGLPPKMNALGHVFTQTSYRHEFWRADGSALAEIDLYLENGNEVMVVEVKTLFNEKGVDALLERVQKLRDNEKLAGVAGKTIYAAAAGVNFTKEARRMITEKGIYLVEVDQENKNVRVAPLSIDEAGKW